MVCTVRYRSKTMKYTNMKLESCSAATCSPFSTECGFLNASKNKSWCLPWAEKLHTESARPGSGSVMIKPCDFTDHMPFLLLCTLIISSNLNSECPGCKVSLNHVGRLGCCTDVQLFPMALGRDVFFFFLEAINRFYGWILGSVRRARSVPWAHSKEKVKPLCWCVGLATVEMHAVCSAPSQSEHQTMVWMPETCHSGD